MIDGIRFAKYLNDTGLMAEEFYFLYRIMFQEENIRNGILKPPSNRSGEDESKLFSQLSEIYQQNFTTYLDTKIDWIKISKKLSNEGYLEIWGNSKESDVFIKLTECKVTEKFKNIFLISDIEQAFNDVLELYPKWLFINGTKIPAIDNSPQELAKLYSEHVLKGRNSVLHERFLLLTKKYLDERQLKGAPYGLTNWITKAYHGVAYALENGEDVKNNFGFDVHDL